MGLIAVCIVAVSCIRPENEIYLDFERINDELKDIKEALVDIEERIDMIDVRRWSYGL